MNDTMRYFLCCGKTDMRKGMNSLCGVIQNQMGYDVRMGDVFIFINGSRTTMKLLHAEDGGLVLYIKRLEEGTFVNRNKKCSDFGKKNYSGNGNSLCSNFGNNSAVTVVLN